MKFCGQTFKKNEWFGLLWRGIIWRWLREHWFYFTHGRGVPRPYDEADVCNYL